jgi:hypothetical protein
VQVITPMCTICGKYGVLDVDYDALLRWQGGELIQNAFPHLPRDQREQLKTGIHAACWNKLFPPEEQ